MGPGGTSAQGAPRPRTAAAWPLALAGAAAAMLLLLAPALWNGYPLLQYDTGGYLARWYEGYLVPSRSTVFGLYLHLGEGLHFWPVVVAQSALALWVIALTLRVFGLGGARLRLAVVAALALLTTLPFLAGVLITDIFVGLAVLALHLLAFHGAALRRAERLGLFALVAFAGATHSGTLAVLLGLLAAGLAARPLIGGRPALRGLLAGALALALGALMLVVANFALSGRLAWTPGGYGIAFGRMLQDGIVARYLADRCPDARLRLCAYRDALPPTADEFLWGDDTSPFNKLGRFDGMEREMRTIVLESLAAYPGAQLAAALRATADQLALVATGAGVNDEVWHTYGIIERYIRGEAPAMRAARQQHGAFNALDAVNRLHVPVAWGSMIGLVLIALARLWRDRKDGLGLIAATVVLAILANAVICGVLSGPHDRYGARIVWIATLVVMMAGLRLLARARTPAPGGHRTVTAAP